MSQLVPIQKFFRGYVVSCARFTVSTNVRLFRQTNKFPFVLHTNIMYTYVKKSTFLNKNGWMRLWITKFTFNFMFKKLQYAQCNDLSRYRQVLYFLSFQIYMAFVKEYW